MASILLSKLDFPQLVEQEKKDMKQNQGMNIMKIVDKMVENLTLER